MAFDFDDALDAGKSLFGGGGDDDDENGDDDGGGFLDSLTSGAKSLFGGDDDDDKGEDGDDDGGGLVDSLIGGAKGLFGGGGDDDGKGDAAVPAAAAAATTAATAAQSVASPAGHQLQTGIDDDIVTMTAPPASGGAEAPAANVGGADASVGEPDAGVSQPDAGSSGFVAEDRFPVDADPGAIDHAPPEVPMPEAEIATVPEPTFDERIELADTMEDSLTDDLFEGLE